MKILVDTPTFLPVVCGAETVIYEIFQRLAQHHEVKILTPWLDFPRIKKNSCGQI